jgi:WD40 repeat protein
MKQTAYLVAFLSFLSVGCSQVTDSFSAKGTYSVIEIKEVGHFVRSLDEGKFAMQTEDGIIRIWDLETGRELHKVAVDTKQSGAALLPGGKHKITWMWEWDDAGDNTVRIWDIQTGRELYKLEGRLLRSAGDFGSSPDGTKAQR